jgi:mono/diheme cytochrome c family protein
MLDETSAQLVPYLAHPNGWWRDTAQKLLVLRDDKSVVPALTTMATQARNPLARLDALWTLEGLGDASPALVREKLSDNDPHVRVAAIRVSESLFKNGDKSLVPDIKALAYDSDPNVVIQVMMTAHLLDWPDATKLIERATNYNRAEGVREIGSQILHPPGSPEEFTEEQKKLFDRGAVIYKELCFACHGSDGKGAPLQGAAPGSTIAPPLSHSKTATGFCDGFIDVVLKGLKGPVNGKKYDALMVPMESNHDEWLAAVTSYVRNSFGNKASFVQTSDVARARKAAKNCSEPWTLEELRAALPQPLTNKTEWTVSASHQSSKAPLAIDGDIKTRYDTGVPQVPGMWFEIELPKTATVSGLELDAAESARDYPRGYEVAMSDDGKTWNPPVAKGTGTGATTEIFFPPAKGKFIRITQTGSVDGLYWSIHELNIFKPPRFVQKNSTAPKKSEKSEYE